ncbi:MAG: hypothetical protein DHS20C14_21190 [Phycisphaeraceae bacterium]|nr:MAG: hypothetical protein DHS20C14_21190 [Phycisphaeraceae bacterium]
MNQNDTFIRAKSAELEAITGAASSIRDTDFAAETAELVRLQVLEQAQLATMTIGRQNAGAVLALIDSSVQGAGKGLGLQPLA